MMLKKWQNAFNLIDTVQISAVCQLHLWREPMSSVVKNMLANYVNYAQTFVRNAVQNVKNMMPNIVRIVRKHVGDALKNVEKWQHKKSCRKYEEKSCERATIFNSLPLFLQAQINFI